MNASEKRAALAGAIREGRFVVAPGVYDMISAKVADGMGFGALYMTGYGVAASHLGLPDAGSRATPTSWAGSAQSRAARLRR